MKESSMKESSMKEWYYRVYEDCSWYKTTLQIRVWYVIDKIIYLPEECDDSALQVEQYELLVEMRAYSDILDVATAECESMDKVIRRHEEACRLERDGDISFSDERIIERKGAWTKFNTVYNDINMRMGYLSDPE
jgi:hypothetical protein